MSSGESIATSKVSEVSNLPRLCMCNHPCRISRQVSSVQASDVVLVDIIASGMNGVEFSMFVLTSDSSAVLDQQALLQAVQVSICHTHAVTISMA